MKLPPYKIVTDASEDGAFGYLLEDKFKVLLRRSFDEEERGSSSTMRVLKYIYTSDLAEAWSGLHIYQIIVEWLVLWSEAQERSCCRMWFWKSS